MNRERREELGVDKERREEKGVNRERRKEKRVNRGRRKEKGVREREGKVTFGESAGDSCPLPEFSGSEKTMD